MATDSRGVVDHQPALLRPAKALASKIFKVSIVSFVFFLMFVTSLLLNLVLVINYCLFRCINVHTQRWINSWLQRLMFMQLTTIVEWYCGSRFRIFFKDAEARAKFGKEPLLAIGNHTYQVDILFYLLLGDHSDALHSIRGFPKSILRYMPVFGPLFTFCEFIYLKRKWEADKRILAPAVDRLMEYRFPIWLVLQPEGTRFTPEKHQNSLKWAEKNGQPIDLKHHLVPRVKGFNYVLRHLNTKHNNKFALYNIEIAVPKHIANNINTIGFASGQQFVADVFVERIDESRLPSADADEKEYSQLLFDIFKQKDELVESYHKYGVFGSRCACKFIRKTASVTNLLIVLFMNTFISGTILGWLVWYVVVTQNVLLQLLILGLVIVGCAGIFGIYFSMQKSNYGTAHKNEN